ncbi:MAG: glycosyl hydrolase [Mangrovibacterium sp.]
MTNKLILLILLLSIRGIAFPQKADCHYSTTTKPWAYWWWMGSSVTKEGITANLTKMAEAGFGGVHIIPIYGEKGDENNFIPFLSPRWMEMLVYTADETKRLGMGVDMTSGTGWPFGGPEVDPGTAAKVFQITSTPLTSSNIPLLQDSILNGDIAGYALYDDSGNCIHAEHSAGLPSRSVLAKAKKIDVLHYRPTRQKVKRAAPGGEGLVMDVFSKEAMDQYMSRFEKAFQQTDFTNEHVRAFYNDSYEVYGANFTPDFLKEFRSRRGYDLLPHLQTLADTVQTEKRKRLISDYCETVSDLLLDAFTRTWVSKSHNLGLLTRDQAHGSPGNLLDLYGVADIPETESFGSSGFIIPGLQNDPDYEESRFGRPNPLTMKFASSSAHVKGKQLVSSETATWLADHFKVTLAQVKPQVDELFISGINHIFYHGVTYSPPEKEFPGRLFYASTNFGPLSHFWNELPLLNRYISDCQTILQQTKPDNDILLYFGIHDIWSELNEKLLIRLFDVHHSDAWLRSQATGKLAQKLWDRGYSFDYISDRGLLYDVSSDGQSVRSGGITYKTIIVPALTHMPVETLRQILALARKGVMICFESAVPEDVPGLHEVEKRQQEMKELKAELLKLPNVKVVPDICTRLQQENFPRETMADEKLSFIRKKDGDKTIYFIANLSDRFHEGWIELAKRKEYAELYDVQNNVRGEAMQKDGKIFLQLEPGRSCFLFYSDQPLIKQRYPYYQKQGNPVDLSYGWRLSAVKGLSALPPEITVDTLRSWTGYGEPFLHFSGTIRYSKEFDLPDELLRQDAWRLEIEQLRETAEVIVNGEKAGTIWTVPGNITIPGKLLRKHNRIELDVTNTSFNRVIELDQQKVPWKNFYEINFVNIRYEPFDASGKSPVPSGLIGKVSLVPFRVVVD